MKKYFYCGVILTAILASSLPLYGEEEPPPEIITVEGVASQRRAAPIAALREIDARLRGLPFSVVDGKYVNFQDQAPAAQLDTSDKKVTDVTQLQTGLYRATVEVTAPPGMSADLGQLREEMMEGRAAIGKNRNLLDSRRRARDLASEKAVLSTVGHLYPAGSAPPLLAGRVFYLGAVREWLEGGEYVLLARIKIRLTEP